ncbi:MAG: ssDNA-binding domain-containing protein [Intrasporangiaceae bacterium]|nr:ssDNA-binding domain-containing protein [Intrasporangiaceae bacterium]
MAAKTKQQKNREKQTAKMDSALHDMTEQVIEAIESDPGNWTKPWTATLANGLPINVATKKRYSGGNIFWLAVVGQSRGYSTNVWGTYKQWASVGGQVRKGEGSTLGMFYKMIHITEEEDGEKKTKRVPILKSFPLFNADQVEGGTDIVATRFPQPKQGTVDVIEHAEEFFASIGSDVRFGGDRAFFSPSLDFIQVPERDTFRSSEDFYATLGHEHIHWTGGPDRLDRTKGKHFGDDLYAREELVAELGSAFLNSYLGLSGPTGCGHVAYLASWLRVLKAEPRALWSAVGDAAKALDFLTEAAGENGFEREDEDAQELQTV